MFYLLLLFSHKVVSDSVTPWNVVRQAPLSTGFPRQEYWSVLPFPSPRGLPNPGIKSGISCVGKCILYSWATRPVPQVFYTFYQCACLFLFIHSTNIQVPMTCWYHVVVFFKILQYILPFKKASCLLWRELFLQDILRRIKIRAQRNKICRLMFHLLASLYISGSWGFRLLSQRRWINVLA